MPRKKGADAETETQRAQEARLRYLSRNPEFCRAIECLIKRRNALPGKSEELSSERVKALGPFLAELERVAKEWRVPWVLLSQLSWAEWHKHRNPKESIPAASLFFDSPVTAWTETLSPFVSSTLGIVPPGPTPEDSRYLNLRVDLDHPVHTLLPLIEKELGRHSREHPRGRRRPKQVDFYLRVFDLAEAGETFRTISITLKRRPSTVKSAFLAARRNIFGSAPAPSKKALPIANFDRDIHIQKCSVCTKAEKFEEMCLQARRYALQDHKSQRELTRHDRVR